MVKSGSQEDGEAFGKGICKMTFHVPNEFRVRYWPHAPCLESDDSAGNNGAFHLPANNKRKLRLAAIASDGMGWEHVSVSTATRCPTWDEMCYVKELFWDPEDTVIQFHPPRSEWINNHPYCLHLWRPIGIELPRPPNITVGVR